MRCVYGNHTGHIPNTHTLAAQLTVIFLALLVASCGGSSGTQVPPAPALGNDATLSSLSISGVNMDPAFSASVTEYTAGVPHGTDNVDVSATVSDGNANWTVNGSSDTNVPLVVGENTISILVTAENNTTTRTYTVVVMRAASDNANLYLLQLADARLVPYFEPSTLDYSAAVEFSTAHTQVEVWTDDANATVTVNGNVVASGSSSDPIALSEGSNTVLVRVTAADGASTQMYTATIIRPSASLFVGKAYIKAPNLSEADYFGSGVALSDGGSTLAVGSTEYWLDNYCGEDVVARSQPIRVYTNDSGDDWAEQPPVLLDSNAISAYDFELSADGARMALVRRGSDYGLFVLNRGSDGQWSEHKLNIDVSPSGDPIGIGDVALSANGDTLAVAVGTFDVNMVVSFVHDSEGIWTQHASIQATDAQLENDFAKVITLSGDGMTLAVGAPDTSVYVFTRDSDNSWVEQARISAAYIDYSEQWSFGQSIALSSDGLTLAISEYYNNLVYMYKRESNDVWVEQQQLGPPRGPLLRNPLALSADGSTLAARQFIYDQIGEGDWVLAAQAHPWTGDPGYFAFDVSLSADGTTLVVGSPGDSTGAIGVNGVDPGIDVCNSGAAYLFER